MPIIINVIIPYFWRSEKMKFESKIYEIGSGLGVYLPSVVINGLNLEKNDKCKIEIIEDKGGGDRENSILIIFED